MANVTFLPEKQSFLVKKGTEFQHLLELYPSVPLKFGCRQGHCGACKIRITSGSHNISPKTKQEIKTIEKLGLEGKRLACQCAINGDIEVESTPL